MDRKTVASLINRRIIAVMIAGFASGLPLALSDSTLQAWLTVLDMDIRTIGLFSLVGLPYVLKLFWAPIIDRFGFSFLGRRRDWMCITQILAAILLFSLAISTTDNTTLMFVALLSFFLAFISATQDIAVDAYRADLLSSDERGFGAATSVTAYRIAMLFSGAGALVMAEQIGFNNTYIVMAITMLICGCLNFLLPELPSSVKQPKTISEAIINPFKSFFVKDSIFVLLSIIFLYKLGDAFAGRLTTTFLLRGLEFSLTDVGAISKGLGLMASILGGLYGGILMYRLGLYRSLWIFAWLQGLTNLGFFLLAITGKSYIGLAVVIGLENLTGGMGTAAFVALLMAICDKSYTATQFAMLTAFASLGRILAGPPAGMLVNSYDWPIFFFLTFIISLPVIFILQRYKNIVNRLDID